MNDGTLASVVRNRWALVPVGVLAATVASAVLVVTLAVNERNATAAEPDSYRKGAAWDEWKAQLARNGALRWVLTPEFVPSPTGSGLARLEVSVADKHAVPIEGAAVSVEIIPIRDADSRIGLALAESSTGRYGVEVPLRSGGLWELRVTVDWKGRRYCDRIRRSVTFGRDEP
jgi:hypothetical protein